jgi:transglutaminase-like putative cysteine protease
MPTGTAVFKLSHSKLLLLLLSLLAVTLPHAAHIPIWVTVLLLIICAWKLAGSLGLVGQPGRLARILIILAAMAGIFLSYRTLLGRDAGVALLVIMAGLKLMELNTRRDVVVLLYLGMFLIITNFLYSQSILMAAWMLLSVLLLMTSMISINHRRTGLPLRFYVRQSLKHMLVALPFMLVIFLLFPRIEGPLWNLPRDAHSGITGLNDSMTPGNISKLAKSDAVAFRVDFDDDIPPKHLLYWRGPVLDNFNGNTWSASHLSKVGALDVDYLGRDTRYTITLEAHNRTWLFALDIPASRPFGSHINFHHQLLARKAVRRRKRYRLRSFLDYRLNPQLEERIRNYYLQVPAGINPRTLALARTMRSRYRDDAVLIRQWLQRFRTQDYRYTLSPERLGGDSIDQFLFDTREGFCEHYASAFAFAMRASGIPARIVTGYQGGELNKLGNYLIIRQSDAHAWVEVWLRGRGWVRVDPTSAVAPQRIETGIEAALPGRVFSGRIARSPSPWLRNIALFWDSLNNSWNQWVLAFDFDTQQNLLKKLGINPMRHASLLLWLTGIILGLLGVTYLFMNRRDRRHDERVQALYLRMCRKLARKGIERNPNEGPKAFLQRICRLRPDLIAPMTKITRLYINLRYGRATTTASLQALQQLVRETRV